MKNRNLITYIVGIVIGMIFFFIYAFSGGLFETTTTSELLRVLCDCFTVPGIILGGMGLLSWASNKGAYDMLSYGFGSVFGPFWNLITGKKSEYKRFYEYKVEKEEKRKPWNREFFFVGLGFLALAGITLAAFYMI